MRHFALALAFALSACSLEGRVESRPATPADTTAPSGWTRIAFATDRLYDPAHGVVCYASAGALSCVRTARVIVRGANALEGQR